MDNFKDQVIVSENSIIRPLADFSLGFILIFAFYLQFHGKVSPGGGFQSGIVAALAFIIHDAVRVMVDRAHKFILSSSTAAYFGCVGVLIYALTGVACWLFGGTIFDYAAFSKNITLGRQIGIFSIETGVGLAVFGSISSIYISFRNELLT